ncbi:MAG: chorismate synthase [Deltaproteobacteria bacterium]|mgnify:CR=1 FL=1|nr:chorismate synthase [Deltaproteobacteria bacterium]
MGNSFGTQFRVHTWGESHGGAVGCVIDGCPAGIEFDLDVVQRQLNRRRPGQSALVSQRKETDTVEVLSGFENGRTLGTPLCLVVANRDARPEAYEATRGLYRPSHADYTWQAKFGVQASSGGGRASARETVGRVAAGAVAQQLLRQRAGVEVVAWVEQVHDLVLPLDRVDLDTVSEALVDAGPTRCPDPSLAEQFESRIQAVRQAGDTVGGAVRCVVRGVPVGWGEPVFDKLQATLAHGCMSLPASRGFEIGSGFGAMQMKGSEHNDPFEPDPEGGVRTRTNHSGGIQGGISNGELIVLRVAFKPVSTIFLEQDTVNTEGAAVRFTPKGRHDPCVLPRAVPMVEAMVALALADAYLCQQAQAR